MVTTISVSSLTPYYRQQLAEVFDSIGLVFPTKRKPITVKFVSEDEPHETKPRQRSRSCTPSHRRQKSTQLPQRAWKTPTVSRARTASPEPESSLVDSVAKFFSFASDNGGGFKFSQSWRPRKFVLSKLVAMIDSFLTSSSSLGNAFSERLWNYYQEKLGLRSLVEFTILDIVSNALTYRAQSMEVDIFVRFLEGFYDPEFDFEFFMYMRREILGAIVGAANRGVATLSISDCDQLAKKISSDTKNFLNFKTVMETIRSESRNGDNHVDGVYFMYICLWVFHHQRSSGEPSSAVGSRQVNAPVSDSSQLIDSYIDSIMSLKTQTKLVRNSVNKSLVRDSVNMEEVIGRMLSDCCAERAGHCDKKTLNLADKLMTGVMNGDSGAWSKLVSGPDNEHFFGRAIERRNRLLECLSAEKDDREIEEALYEFCVSIAEVPALLNFENSDMDKVKIRAA